MQQIYRASAKLKFTKIVADTLIGDLQEDRARLDTPAEHSGDINFEHFVKLENINFSYSERNSEALQNVSMQINKGSFVAIVGRTGSGKTTLVDLLLGLLEPDSGELSVDEIQINQPNAPMWRRQVGYVPQQIFLADDTLSANIALGIPEQLVDQEKVERAAQIAQVNEFIDQLPQGFATFLGERGVRLSGGQRQRVGLARAIYSSPSVLILDEATSSLDSITERAVMSAVHHLKGEMTTIVVAHRLSTVMNSDEIFIFDSGALVESGQYQQLLKTSELFKDLASQFEDATD